MKEQSIYSEAFRKLEQSEVKLSDIVEMFWYVIEDYYAPHEKIYIQKQIVMTD